MCEGLHPISAELPPPKADVQFTIASSESAIVLAVEGVKRLMQLLALENEWIFRGELSLQEALLNSYLHGNRRDPSKAIWVYCSLSPGRVRIEVEDEGLGYEPGEDPSCRDLTGFDGRGLYLIHELMHSVTVNPRGNHIVMSLLKE